MKEALKALWHAAFPGEELHALISDQWKEMGWQGKDPSTDFRYSSVHLFGRFFFLSMLLSAYFAMLDRGGGFISLENLLFFARNFRVCSFAVHI